MLATVQRSAADGGSDTLLQHPMAASRTTEDDTTRFIDDTAGEIPHLDSLASEGIGEDDESDDEDDGMGSEPSARPSKRNRRAYPRWFNAAFDKAVAWIEKTRKGTTGRSDVYAAESFWVPLKSPYFRLDKPNLQPRNLFLPKFFLWDLDNLLRSGIACPLCQVKLNRGGIVRRPRRIVEINHTFWIIGYTYECRGTCQKRFRSWDSRIIAQLPRSLAAQFPAYLTWRSGLSLDALGVLRSCVQSGMGAHQVADMFRMQHLKCYDELRLQYLHSKVFSTSLPGESYQMFPSFDDYSDDGFHGFVPGGQWLRDVYDVLIEKYQHVLNQHTAMLSGRVCAIDHSHKVCRLHQSLAVNLTATISLPNMCSKLTE